MKTGLAFTILLACLAAFAVPGLAADQQSSSNVATAVEPVLESAPAPTSTEPDDCALDLSTPAEPGPPPLAFASTHGMCGSCSPATCQGKEVGAACIASGGVGQCWDPVEIYCSDDKIRCKCLTGPPP